MNNDKMSSSSTQSRSERRNSEADEQIKERAQELKPMKTTTGPGETSVKSSEQNSKAGMSAGNETQGN